MKPEEVESMFTYHSPVGNQTERYQMIREAGRKLAHTINHLSPFDKEAVALVQQAVMKANASIACSDSEKMPGLDMGLIKKRLEAILNGEMEAKETLAHVPDANDPFHNDQPKH